MALDDGKKEALRLLIEANPKADYMAQLVADDNFALNEIKVKAPEILALKQNTVKNHLAYKEYLDRELEKLYADMTILEGVL